MTTPSPTPDVEALHAACDRLVACAPDAAAARNVLLRMWALGATARDDLLADLQRVAVQHAARTGAHATLPELLHALGLHHEADAHQRAVSAAADEGLDPPDFQLDHRLEARSRAQTSPAASVRAARAAARIHQITQHRHPLARAS